MQIQYLCRRLVIRCGGGNDVSMCVCVGAESIVVAIRRNPFVVGFWKTMGAEK